MLDSQHKTPGLLESCFSIMKFVSNSTLTRIHNVESGRANSVSDRRYRQSS